MNQKQPLQFFLKKFCRFSTGHLNPDLRKSINEKSILDVAQPL
jgi:hypothetical protein